MPRDPRDKYNITWENRYGTTVSGNLPTHIIGTCVEDVVDIVSVQTTAPWVSIEDFHFYHIKCPYSTESTWHFVLDTKPSSPTYWVGIDVSGESVSHTSTSGLMIRHTIGSKNGWLCVDPACPVFLGTASGSYSGMRYFYY